MTAQNVNVDVVLTPRIVLSADAITTLDGVVRRSLAPVGIVTPLRYRVLRTDGADVEYDSLDEVLAEPNGPASRITALTLAATSDDTDLKLRFDRAEGLQLVLRSSKRSEALALLNDLRITTKDLADGVTRVSQRLTLWLPVALVAAAWFAFNVWTDLDSDRRSDLFHSRIEAAQDRREELSDRMDDLLRGPDGGDADKLIDAQRRLEDLRAAGARSEKLESVLFNELVLRPLEEEVEALNRRALVQDELDKVNTELELAREPVEYPERPLVLRFGVAWFVIGAVGGGLLGKYLGQALRGPVGGILLIGQEAQEYARRQSRREKVIWAIGMAFSVGVIASLVAWRIAEWL